MFYIGFFQFEGKLSKGVKAYGDFQCVAHADNLDGALKKFERLLVKEKKDGELSDHRKLTIFLTEVLEIKKKFEEAALVQHQIFMGERPQMCIALCPIEDGEVGQIYPIRPAHFTPEEFRRSIEEEYFPEPFMVFK